MSSQRHNHQGPSPLDQSLMLSLVGYNCRRAFAAIEPFFHKRMAAFQLRPSDFAVLSLLRANARLSQKRVAQGIGVSAPNLAPVLDRLESRGLIQRQRNPSDKRFQTLALTADGVKLYCAAEKVVIDLENEATSMLNTEERGQLIALLQKIYLE